MTPISGSSRSSNPTTPAATFTSWTYNKSGQPTVIDTYSGTLMAACVQYRRDPYDKNRTQYRPPNDPQRRSRFPSQEAGPVSSHWVLRPRHDHWTYQPCDADYASCNGVARQSGNEEVICDTGGDRVTLDWQARCSLVATSCVIWSRRPAPACQS